MLRLLLGDWLLLLHMLRLLCTSELLRLCSMHPGSGGSY